MDREQLEIGTLPDHDKGKHISLLERRETDNKTKRVREVLEQFGLQANGIQAASDIIQATIHVPETARDNDLMHQSKQIQRKLSEHDIALELYFHYPNGKQLFVPSETYRYDPPRRE